MAILDKFFLKDPALKKVKYAQKRYEEAESEAEKTATYFVILTGMGFGKLSLCPGDPHRYDMIIDAIHTYQKRHPNKKVKEGYTDTILMSMSGVSAKCGLEIILEWFDYEVEKQEKGTNAFTLDYRMLLKKLRGIVAERIDKFRAETPQFDMWFEGRLKYIEERTWRAR